MIYPLGTMNWDQPENRALIEQSLDHWIGFKGALQGYSYTGASLICSRIGRRDEAVKLLNQFLDKYVKPNTLYTESGPVIETPLSAARAIQEIVLQSWGGKIRIFPAVPDGWKDASLASMRAEGAFLVDAVRSGGKTTLIRLTSLAGRPCRIVTDMTGPTPTDPAVHLQPQPDGSLLVPIKKGQTITLLPAGQSTPPVIQPVQAQPDRQNYYGLNK
jgi:hypothetical protein